MLHCPGWSWHQVYSWGVTYCGFREIGRTLIQRCVQVINLNHDPVRYAVVRVATVVVGRRWISTGERIDPGARTHAALAAIQAGRIGVGTSRARDGSRRASAVYSQSRRRCFPMP